MCVCMYVCVYINVISYFRVTELLSEYHGHLLFLSCPWQVNTPGTLIIQADLQKL